MTAMRASTSTGLMVTSVKAERACCSLAGHPSVAMTGMARHAGDEEDVNSADARLW